MRMARDVSMMVSGNRGRGSRRVGGVRLLRGVSRVGLLLIHRILRRLMLLGRRLVLGSVSHILRRGGEDGRLTRVGSVAGVVRLRMALLCVMTGIRGRSYVGRLQI